MKLDDMAIEDLPYPPSINHYYGYRCAKCNSPRVYVHPTTKAKKYRKAVRDIATTAEPLEGILACSIELWTPDRRIRDLDNVQKALLDAITAAGLWGDDKQIDKLSIERAGVLPGSGRARVTIEQIDQQTRLF